MNESLEHHAKSSDYQFSRRLEPTSLVRRSVYLLGPTITWCAAVAGTMLLVVLFFYSFSQHAAAQTNPRVVAASALLTALVSVYSVVLGCEFFARRFLNWQRQKADKAFASNDLVTARSTYERCLRRYEKSGAANSSDIMHCLKRLVEIHSRTEGTMPTQLMDLQLQGWKQSLRLYESNLAQKQLSSLEIEQRRKAGLKLRLALPFAFGLISIRIWFLNEPGVACIVMAVGLLLSICWWFELKRTLLRRH
ncbi:MAG: hypothetical protein K2W95_00595 [Candidatus Obscuribacterales bacterium]|nr:hypothetical protein [Candidatus Obscuribacterales bacterium]